MFFEVEEDGTPLIKLRNNMLLRDMEYVICRNLNDPVVYFIISYINR